MIRTSRPAFLLSAAMHALVIGAALWAAHSAARIRSVDAPASFILSPPELFGGEKTSRSIADQIALALRNAEVEAWLQAQRERETSLAVAPPSRVVRAPTPPARPAPPPNQSASPSQFVRPPAIDVGQIWRDLGAEKTAQPMNPVATISDENARYVDTLKARLQAALRRETELLPDLSADAEVRILPDGRLSQARIVKPSGNEAFDRAVLRTVASVRMASKPDGVPEWVVITFVAC